jgi:hypothetical protein
MNSYQNLNLKEISICEVCDNNDLKPVLNLGLHPMCDDLVPINDSRVCKEYPIEILYCNNCFTAHQKYQIPKDELFPKTYHYRSRFTADVLKGMEDLVASCENEFGDLSNKKVLDIGCNDGSLLDFFRFKGAVTFGIEPTGAADDAIAKGHTVINDFLSPTSAQNFVNEYGTMDFICFTNVFAHIENLKEVIASLKLLIHPATVIVIENHYLGAVLNYSQFDTFYHEHPRTYSYNSFIYIAKSLGLKLINVQFPSRYGGNIRVYMGNSGSQNNHDQNVLEQEKQFETKFFEMNQQIANWKKSKTSFVSDLVQKQGKLIGKAFPGRAAILIKLLGLTENEISVVYEKPGSMKIGHYIPGTRIPIDSDDQLFANGKKDCLIFNLAWHISNEIESYLKKNGFAGRVVNILGPEDLK